MRLFSNFLTFTSESRGNRADSRVIETGALSDISFQQQFRWFAVFWAIATLFHMAHSSLFDSQLNFALLTVAAFVTILRPSLTSFLLLAVLQIFDAFFRMPFTTNHWIFTAFVNVTILQAWLSAVLRERSLSIGESRLFRTIAPVLRIELIILYFFAVFHKLNSGFFSPLTSCATELLAAQHLESIVPVPEFLFTYNAYITIFIEAFIPLAICFRKTRTVGILTGIFFHCVLAYSTYNAFYDFSSMVMAMYFLFTAPAMSTRLSERLRNFRSGFNRWWQHYTPAKLLMICLTSFGLLGVLFFANKSIDSFREVHLYFFWTLYCLAFATLLITFGFQRPGETISFRPAHAWLWFLPAVVFINGVCPYIGLKTENSYAMFSNLRTEGGVTNHYIVPPSVQVFDFQKDVVEIVSSTDPFFQHFATEGKAMVLFEFTNQFYRRKPEKISYRLNGNPHFYERANGDKGPPANPAALTKLMRFRAFSVSEPQPCSH